jgi:NADPH:quinone reductase-like Zn-dependent oxidoreductase
MPRIGERRTAAAATPVLVTRNKFACLETFKTPPRNTLMRSYRLRELGSLDGLVTADEEIPTPGLGQVLVKVGASSLNFRDLVIVNGWFPFPIAPGRIPLSDGAGEVVAVGDGVSRFKIGDRVVNAFFPNWLGGSFNVMPEQYVVQHDGWLSEYRVVAAEALAKVPEGLSLEDAATLPCAGVTAWSAIAGVGPGDTVLTQGTGGVSLFAVQLAKAAGARVIATTSSSEKAEKLKSLGADHVIDYAANSDWGTQARELTGGRGVDRVVEVGGPDTMQQSLKAVCYGGQISLVGILAGAAGSIDFMEIFASQSRLQTISVGSRRDLEDLIRVIEQHRIKPVIDSVYAFEEAKSAFEHLAKRKLFGKVVIRH